MYLIHSIHLCNVLGDCVVLLVDDIVILTYHTCFQLQGL